MKIFLSYSRKDGEFIKKLAGDIQHKGFSTWLDVGDIYAGKLWRKEIVEGIENCAAFVIAISSNAIKSENVVKELSIAESAGKKIFPILIEEVDIPREMKYQIAGVQLVSFQNTDYNASLKSLLAGFANAGIEADFSENNGEQRLNNFVGRENELAALNKLLDRCMKPETVLSFIAGEAGSGKTTLLNEFRRIALRKSDNLISVKGKFNPDTGHVDPYFPFVEILRKLTGDTEAQTLQNESSDLIKNKQDAAKNAALQSLVDCSPGLVGTFISSSYLQKHLTANRVQEHNWCRPLEELLSKVTDAPKIERSILFQQYSDFLIDLSKRYQLLLIIEDLQWADEASLELFLYLGKSLESSPVMILATYRPEEVETPDTDQQSSLDKSLNIIKQTRKGAWIDLDSIANETRLLFTSALVDLMPNELSKEFREKLFNHTQGNPLFTVELLLDLQERGCLIVNSDGRLVEGANLDWNVLPGALEGVIEQRIGQLSEDLRNILTVASVEGNNFTVQVVSHIEEINERDLIKKLSRELDKHHRLVKETGAQRINKKILSNFSFSNSMFQRYLYGELTQGEKFNLHSQIAAILEELYADDIDRIAAQLARHYDLAGETDNAIKYSSLVGKRALRLSAYDAAQVHLSRAIELAHELPKSVERDRLELDLQLPLSAAIKVTKGWASAEVIEIYNKARLLCKSTGNNEQLAPVLYGLWAVQLVHLQLDKASAIAEECMELGKQLNDDDMVLQGYLAMGNTNFWLGNQGLCYEMMQKVFELYKPDKLEFHLERYGQDPRVMGLTFTLLSAGILGKNDEAAKVQHEIMELADQLEHPFSRAIALQAVAWHQYHLHDTKVVLKYAGELAALSKANGFLFYYALGLMLEGWAIAMEGDTAAGLEKFEEGLKEWNTATGGELFLHSLYSLIKTEIYIKAGRWEECNKIINKGLEVTKTHNEKCYESVLYYYAGYVIENLSPGLAMAARSCYENAMTIARKQNSLLFELRSGLAMAKLLYKEDQVNEARELLGKIYSGFSGKPGIENFEDPKSVIYKLI